MIVAEQTYELSDPTVDSQIISLKASGADAFFGAIGGKQASQVYRKMYDIGWRPHVYLSVAGTPRDTILKAAGFETAVGFISAYWGKDASILDYENDPAVLEYIAWAGKWYGDSNAATDGIALKSMELASAIARLRDGSMWNW
jgi:branched-chain amino acid transport system substrate-binding protein